MTGSLTSPLPATSPARRIDLQGRFGSRGRPEASRGQLNGMGCTHRNSVLVYNWTLGGVRNRRQWVWDGGFARGGRGWPPGDVVVAGGLYLWAFGLGLIVPDQPLEIMDLFPIVPLPKVFVADKDGTAPKESSLSVCTWYGVFPAHTDARARPPLI